MSIQSTFSAAIGSGKINGAILMACDSKGHEYQQFLGQRTLLDGKKVEHQPSDILFLASATKLLTTLAALQCVEDGLLTLDQPLDNLGLPDQVLTAYDQEPSFTPADPITLRQLLTHTSGLVYPFLSPAIQKWNSEHSATAKNPDSKLPVEECMYTPLAFQPGSNWLYGTGLDWAGRVLEKKTGESLGYLICKKVLKTDDAEFYPVQRLRERAVDVNPADPDGAGKAVAGVDINVHEHGSGDFGGQGLFTTAPAYLSVLRSLLANDGALLKPETVDQIFCNQLGTEAQGKFNALLKSPGGSGFSMGTTGPAGFGLGGLLTLEDAPGWFGANTMIWTGGQTFLWFVDRQNDICGICAIQASLPLDSATVKSLKEIFCKNVYSERKSWHSI